MNRPKQPGLRPLLACALMAVSLLAYPLAAETRIYQSTKPIQDFIPSFIDQLGGLQFKVVRNYTEATDGKLGFVLALMPGQRYCDISFLDNQGKGTLLKISTQDRSDGELFTRIAARMGMSEPGVHQVPDGSNSVQWPGSTR